MIKIENGKVNLKGNIVELKIDLAMMIISIREVFAERMSQDEADENIREAIRVGFMTEEEFRDESKRVKSKISEKFGGTIEDITELIDEVMLKRTEEKENEHED